MQTIPQKPLYGLKNVKGIIICIVPYSHQPVSNETVLFLMRQLPQMDLATENPDHCLFVFFLCNPFLGPLFQLESANGCNLVVQRASSWGCDVVAQRVSGWGCDVVVKVYTVKSLTKSLDTTSLSLQQHICWELFNWSLYKMYWLQQQSGYGSTKQWNQWCRCKQF